MKYVAHTHLVFLIRRIQEELRLLSSDNVVSKQRCQNDQLHTLTLLDFDTEFQTRYV